MGNPLLSLWHQIFGPPRPPALVRPDDGEELAARVLPRGPGGEVPPEPRIRERRLLPMASAAQASETIFLVLRRMRVPFIVLITIFAVSTLGLLLIPGQDADGAAYRMGLLDAFYVITYTATTIGFGEIPHAFTDAQRLWVIAAIFLSVLGWAYAIGTLFALVQDREFRQALALQRFIRTVSRMREPFLLMAGHGQTGERLGLSLDALGRRFIVLDRAESRVAALDQEAYHYDVPGLVADARNPAHLMAAGLDHPSCEGVLAVTDNEEANLAVVMSTALLRPDLPVIARAYSASVVERMRMFGDPLVVNPFDAFGDHLRIALHAPSSYQLEQWLTALPGEPRPDRRPPVPRGRWVVCGYGRFGQAVTQDLRAEGLEVTVVDAGTTTSDDPSVLIAPGIELDWMARADVETAVGLVTATANDISNLSLIAAAREANPRLFIVGRRNERANELLFAAVRTDLVLVPPDVVAHEVLSRLGSPELVRFLQAIPRRLDSWAADLVAQLDRRCRPTALVTWHVPLTEAAAPALQPWLATGEARLGDLLRSPVDRDVPVEAVALMLVREGRDVLAPGDDVVLAPGDVLFLAGHASARHDLATILVDEATREYVLHDREVPSGWLWRKLSPSPR
jgi:Trk K+ transport system NAD-binding subunit